jgi:hypothetical protein
MSNTDFLPKVCPLPPNKKMSNTDFLPKVFPLPPNKKLRMKPGAREE